MHHLDEADHDVVTAPHGITPSRTRIFLTQTSSILGTRPFIVQYQKFNGSRKCHLTPEGFRAALQALGYESLLSILDSLNAQSRRLAVVNQWYHPLQ